MWRIPNTGHDIELRYGTTNFEYRYLGTSQWLAIAPIEDLQGPQGAPGNIEDFFISVFIPSPEVGTTTLILGIPNSATVSSINCKTDSGTATFTMKINTTAVTGLSSIAANSTKASYTATSTNAMIVNDDLKLEFTSISDPVNFSMLIKFN